MVFDPRRTKYHHGTPIQLSFGFQPDAVFDESLRFEGRLSSRRYA
jgi:hypothetical protein